MQWKLVAFVVAIAVVQGSTGLVEAQFVGPGGGVPVVAHTPGVGGTFWRSDVSLVNLEMTDATVGMFLLPEIVGGSPAFEPVLSEPILVPAGEQLTMRDVLLTRFGISDGKGALQIFSFEGGDVVLSSRIYVFDDDGGTYGQDITGVQVYGRGWAAGLQNDAFYRTNLGVYLPVDPMPGEVTRFTVTVRDGEGNEVGEGTFTFPAAGVQQRSLDSLGIGTLLDGWLEVTCSDPSIGWYAYASLVDEVTADAVFRPVRGRQPSP